MKVKVVHVETDVDMRMKHELRESKKAEKLKPGECLVAINRAKDMARIIDCEGGVHDYYAYAGMKFDVSEISGMMKRGLGIELTGQIGKDETKQVAATKVA